MSRGSAGSSDLVTNTWLRGLLDRHAAVAGTVHVRRDDLLHIAAAHNVPSRVQEVTARMPLRKGITGLVWRHGSPVPACGLLEDDRGAAEPGAEAVDGVAAVAVPVYGADGAIRAVVGLAWPDERDLTAGELAMIGKDAAILPDGVPRP